MTRSTPTLFSTQGQPRPADPTPVHGAPQNPPQELDRDTIESLTALLEQQSGLYTQLTGLGQKQHDQITNGSVQELLDILSTRQGLIDELTQIEQKLRPFRQNWQALWQKLSEPDRQRITATLDASQRALALIIEQDNQSRTLLENARDQIGNELTKISHTGAAMRAYGTQPASDNRFTNRQG